MQPPSPSVLLVLSMYLYLPGSHPGQELAPLTAVPHGRHSPSYPTYGLYVPATQSVHVLLFSPSTFNGGLNAGAIVPSLPPSYPGTIIGGTGLFVGAVGYVDVTTITGSTLTPVKTGVDGTFIDGRFPQAGYITQKINVVTNVPLPVAP